MLAPELKQPQNLRRVTADIVSPLEHVIIRKNALGYLIGAVAPNKPARALFVSLCEMYEFDVTEVPSDFFKTI